MQCIAARGMQLCMKWAALVHQASHERMEQDVAGMKRDGVDAAPLPGVLPPPSQPCRIPVTMQAVKCSLP